MSVAKVDDNRKVTTHRLIEMKQRGEKISMLTAYDYSMAKLIDQAGMDVILVGDSASNVMAGNVTTLPITLDQMIYHGKSVMKAVNRALVVVDLPFGTYQGNSKEALASAIRVMKETHADCIKLEGGDRGQLILAADEQTLPALQSLLFPEEPLDTSDVFHLFFSFLESLIQEDMLYLQNFEKRLATIEESLLDTLPKELQRTLITIRRELLVFHAYYQQLLDMCEILSEDENHFLPPECARQFSRLGNRVDRLYDHTQMLREYALQIREMQQAQIDLRQNDTMRILTVVSTIFFPLSLIAGWYGMNFTHMPELSAPYAYFILIGVCILIVAVEIWYFKKKGWF